MILPRWYQSTFLISLYNELARGQPSRDPLRNLSSRVTEYLGYENAWEVFIRRRKGRESRKGREEGADLSLSLSRAFWTGCRVFSPPMKLRGRRKARKRESSIYFRLPVPSRSGMIYAERVPQLRAAGEFSLSAPHPTVSPGWRSVPLPSLLPSGAFLRREGRDASFSDDMQLPAIVLLLFSFLLSFAERFRGRGRLIIERPRAGWVMCVSIEQHVRIRAICQKWIHEISTILNIVKPQREIRYNLLTLHKINWRILFCNQIYFAPDWLKNGE